MAAVPKAANASIHIGKLTGYLLDPSHPTGGGKARFWVSRGFHVDAPEVLLSALLDHIVRNQVARSETTEYGVGYVVECTIATPDGRNPCIRSVLMLGLANGSWPRLVTAYAHL